MATFDVSPKRLQESLAGVAYPAEAADLLAHAERRGAARDIRDALRALPGRSYGSIDEVVRALPARPGSALEAAQQAESRRHQTHGQAGCPPARTDPPGRPGDPPPP